MQTWLTIGLISLVVWGAAPKLQAQERSLKVYGPGGPLGPMQECAELFGRLHKIQVKVTAGPENQWLPQARENADLIFGGAEYMLTSFIQRNPGIIDPKTRTSLYPRAAGILVRKGNPKQLKGLKDLARPGINLLDVNGAGQVGLWEDLAGLQGLIADLQRNIKISVTTSAEAIEKWRTMPELDAWITFESWHFRLREETDLVRLPEGQRLFRGTPIAITTISREPELARLFLEFLKTPAAHAIFQKWGWQ